MENANSSSVKYFSNAKLNHIQNTHVIPHQERSECRQFIAFPYPPYVRKEGYVMLMTQHHSASAQKQENCFFFIRPVQQIHILS